MFRRDRARYFLFKGMLCCINESHTQRIFNVSDFDVAENSNIA